MTHAAGNLQKDGLIKYGYGHITVLDRPKLEMRVCECYAVVKNELDRLLPYEIPSLPEISKWPLRAGSKIMTFAESA